jgi:hypothetical protein
MIFEAEDDGILAYAENDNEEKHEFNTAEAGRVRLQSP